jgi:hypothetical protein
MISAPEDVASACPLCRRRAARSAAARPFDNRVVVMVKIGEEQLVRKARSILPGPRACRLGLVIHASTGRHGRHGRLLFRLLGNHGLGRH